MICEGIYLDFVEGYLNPKKDKDVIVKEPVRLLVLQISRIVFI